MQLHLNDLKVYKRFGRHPERGKVMTWLPPKRVTVGVRWSLPHRNHVPDEDVMMRPTVALQRVRSGLWEVKVLPQHWESVSRWLVDYCR